MTQVSIFKQYFLWLLKFLTVIIVIVIGIPLILGLLISMSGGNLAKTMGDGKNTVAVIEVTGVIEDSRDIIDELHTQADNERVKGIVLRVDSPGGSVGPSQEIYNAVKDLKRKKPIVASMGALAASGGLYISVGASKVFCQPGTITGSIGVIMQIPNVSKITDKVGLDMVTIKSGALKDIGNTFREMTEPEREFLQRTVSVTHEEFMKAVSEGRGIEIEKVREFADGRIILGSEALGLKLVDEMGGVYEAARGVFDILGEPLDEGTYPELYYPDDSFREFKHILKGISKLPGLLERTVALRYVMSE